MDDEPDKFFKVYTNKIHGGMMYIRKQYINKDFNFKKLLITRTISREKKIYDIRIVDENTICTNTYHMIKIPSIEYGNSLMKHILDNLPYDIIFDQHFKI